MLVRDSRRVRGTERYRKKNKAEKGSGARESEAVIFQKGGQWGLPGKVAFGPA